MGITHSAHQRVISTLHSTSSFTTACDATYDHCLSLTQHAFPGVFPYQLHSAASHLHSSLSSSFPFPRRWVPSPPSQLHVDSALKKVSGPDEPGETLLGSDMFREWAEEVFAVVVVENAGKEVVRKGSIGVAGIAGVGVVAKLGKEVVGSVIGVYALGVATSVFLALSSSSSSG